MIFADKPDPVNFAGNMRPIVIMSTRAVEMTLSLDGVQVLTEQYSPLGGRVTIPLRELCERITPHALIDMDVVPESEARSIAIPTYRYRLTMEGDTMEDQFLCVNGGHGSSTGAAAFMAANWLTWQPQSVYTTYHRAQRLVFAALGDTRVYATGYFTDGTSETVEYALLAAGRLHTLDTTYGRLCGAFERQPSYIDMRASADMVASYTQRYYLTRESDNADVFVWYNSLGGIDTVSFEGERRERTDITLSSGVFDDTAIDFDVDSKRVYTKFTGYLQDEHTRLWVGDFLSSAVRYHIDGGERREIVLGKNKIEHTRGELTGYEFDFALSRQSRYLNLPRLDQPEELEIVAPGDEVFFLAPRLNEFPRADLAAGELLLPCQYAADGRWLSMTLSDIYREIRGVDGEDALTVNVWSENGNVFIGGNIDTTLHAYVLRGEQDVTDTIAPWHFSWVRRSIDTVGDVIWNELHAGIGPVVEITRDDVFRKATFDCVVVLGDGEYKTSN